MRASLFARRLARLSVLAAGVTLSACSGGGGSDAVTQVPRSAEQTPQPTPTPTLGPTVDSCNDCWPMFMGNAQRTGLQSATTPFTSATVSQLAVRWSYGIGEQTAGSPIVANGLVYVGTGGGSVIAFDERTGTPVWRRQLGGPITMTPTYDRAIVFVATHTAPAQVFALDAQSGSTLWQTSFAGSMRGEPLAIGGIVYIPESGGDIGVCHQGGIHAFEEQTGTPEWTWHVNATPNDGGSVWAPLSYDGRYLVFGTGNACSYNVANANSVVQLSLGGQQNWLVPEQVNSYVDDDFGGGAAVYGGRVFVADKNGKLYAVNDRDGSIAWTVTQSTLDGDGAIGSPATNGSVVIAPSGFVTDPTTNPSAFVGAYDFSGNLLWRVPTHDIVSGGAALTNDIAFVSIDETTVALAIATGAQLWSYQSAFSQYFYGSPAVDSSGVYAVDTFGGVYAFGIAASGAASGAPRRVDAKAAGALRMPYGSIFTTTAGGAVRARF